MAGWASELQQAKRRSEGRLLALPGVTGVDIGCKEVDGRPTGALAIRVLVAQKKPQGAVPADELIPIRIEGHPVDVIERRFELHQLATRSRPSGPPAVLDAISPVKGGVSVGPGRTAAGLHAGTLGAVVTDRMSGRRFALTSWHLVGAAGGLVVGEPLLQPSPIDGGDGPGSVLGTIQRCVLTASVDAAVASIDSTRHVTPHVVEIGALTGTGATSIDDQVAKRGRTTGLTFGIVDAVDLTVKLDYGDGIGVRTLTNQIGVKPDGTRSAVFSAAGDTGAVLVNPARGVVGLLVAGTETGYGVANPIADVLAALDVDLYTGPARDKLRMPVRLSADVTGSTGANEENLGLGDQPGSESSDDPAPSANEDKDVFKEKQEKDERGAFKNAKDFPIKEKEKEEGKDRKENADQDKFDADQKAKNEKDVLIEKPNNKDFFKREKGEFEGPVAGNVPVSLPFPGRPRAALRRPRGGGRPPAPLHRSVAATRPPARRPELRARRRPVTTRGHRPDRPCP